MTRNKIIYALCLLPLVLLCFGCNQPREDIHMLEVLTETPVKFYADGAHGSDFTSYESILNIVNLKKDKLIPILINNMASAASTKSK